jgi:hypothetical protein
VGVSHLLLFGNALIAECLGSIPQTPHTLTMPDETVPLPSHKQIPNGSHFTAALNFCQSHDVVRFRPAGARSAVTGPARWPFVIGLYPTRCMAGL